MTLTTRASSSVTVFHLLFGLALLVGAGLSVTPAFGQVTIEERIELRDGSPSEGGAETRGSASTQAVDGPSIIVPQDGRLRLYFSSAERLYTPIPFSATVNILKKSGDEPPPPVRVAVNNLRKKGEETIQEPVLPHYPNSDSYPRFFTTCGSPRYITQYAYYGGAEEISTFDAGPVAEGDTVTFSYTSDTGTYFGTLTPGGGGAATWNAELGRYDVCLLAWTERVSFSVAVVPDVQLLSQDDQPLAPVAEECLMVSKFVTDENLEDDDQPFESSYVTDGDTTDVYTFRPQLTGIEAGLEDDVLFQVQVLRDGVPTDYGGDDHLAFFNAVEGTLNEGTPDAPPAYRGKRFLRLVSNARPEEGAPGGATYDDEYAGTQTIRAQLGDRLRVMPEVNGTVEDTLDVPVGCPPGSDSPNALRRARLHWQTLESLDSDPATITRRMSEDWAQAGIFFEKDGEDTFETLNNALKLEFRKEGFLGLGGRPDSVSSNGTVQVDVAVGGGSPQSVTTSYNEGDLIGEIAFGLRQAIASAASGLTLDDTDNLQSPDEPLERTIVITDFHFDVRFSTPQGSDDIEFSKVEVDRGFLDSERELNIVGNGARDDDDQTIDVIVLPDKSLPTQPGGIAFGSSGYDDKPEEGLKNLIFLVESAADEDDDYPTIAGHEAGHVLFNSDFPGNHRGDDSQDGEDESHSATLTNLMYRPDEGDEPAEQAFAEEIKAEALDGPKRLTEAQQADARGDSGPGSSGPVLLQPAEPSDGNASTQQEAVAQGRRE